MPGANGFENDGLSLRLSSVLIERYMEAADLSLKAALIHGSKPPDDQEESSTTKNERTFKLAIQERKWRSWRMPWSSLNEKTLGLSQFKATTAGRYRFRVSAYSHHNEGKPMVMAVHTGQRALGHYAVPADKPGVVEFVVALEQNGNIHFTPDSLKKDRKLKEKPGLAIEWVEVEGPLIDVWPPESYQRLLGTVEAKNAKLADAERALRTFIPKAFRRPGSEELLRPYIEMVSVRLAEGYPFLDALQVAMKAILCSPHFLLLESQPGRLDDFALATRLSYFLWSSMPDAELFDLAGKKELHKPPVLRQQVERMLKDPKAAAFSESFLDQWLDLRQIDSTVPDKALYPEFGELLKISMLQESRLFFEELLKNDPQSAQHREHRSSPS